MPDALAAKTDRMAAELGVTRSELIQRALERFVLDSSEDAVTHQLDRLYRNTNAALPPEFAASQRAILDDEGW